MQNTLSQVRLQNIREGRAQGAIQKDKGTIDAQLADPFLQIIMNMISQNQELMGNQTQQGEGLAGTIQNAELLGGELFAIMPNGQQNPLIGLLSGIEQLSINPQGELDYGALPGQQQSSTAGANPALDAILTQLGANQSAANLMAQVPEKVQEAAIPIATGLFSLNEAKPEMSFREALAQMTGLSTNDGMPVIGNGETEGLQNGQREFGGAVQEAKELLSQMPKRETQKELDVDSLQGMVTQAKVSTPFELRFKTVTQAPETPIADQISQGIKNNLHSSKGEFTIKLRPESLGEITIKLVEEAGKTTLSITTASAQTAKLINNELAALKQAVAPMHVEVNEAVTQSQQSHEGTMQQFDMAGQQFAQQQFAQRQFAEWQSAHSSNIGAAIPDEELIGEEAVSAADAAGLHAAMSTRIDAYI